MGVKNIPELLDKLLRPARNAILIIAAGTLAVMMLMSALDVGLRYIFDSPIPGGMELVEFMMVIIVPFALTVAAYDNAHIEVDMVMERFPEGVQRYVGCLNSLTVTAFSAIITWQSYLYIGEQYDSGLTSAVLLIPHYPFVILLAIAFALLTLVSFTQFLKNLIEICSTWTL
jgi:TRAP-type C4-dicarboxylate transport system permease small subunit